MKGERTPEQALAARAKRHLKRTAAAWEELPDGVFTLDLASPQFALRQFRADLVELARRHGYQVAEYSGPTKRWLVFERKGGA